MATKEDCAIDSALKQVEGKLSSLQSPSIHYPGCINSDVSALNKNLQGAAGIMQYLHPNTW